MSRKEYETLYEMAMETDNHPLLEMLDSIESREHLDATAVGLDNRN